MVKIVCDVVENTVPDVIVGFADTILLISESCYLSASHKSKFKYSENVEEAIQGGSFFFRASNDFQRGLILAQIITKEPNILIFTKRPELVKSIMPSSKVSMLPSEKQENLEMIMNKRVENSEISQLKYSNGAKLDMKIESKPEEAKYNYYPDRNAPNPRMNSGEKQDLEAKKLGEDQGISSQLVKKPSPFFQSSNRRNESPPKGMSSKYDEKNFFSITSPNLPNQSLSNPSPPLSNFSGLLNKDNPIMPGPNNPVVAPQPNLKQPAQETKPIPVVNANSLNQVGPQIVPVNVSSINSRKLEKQPNPIHLPEDKRQLEVIFKPPILLGPSQQDIPNLTNTSQVQMPPPPISNPSMLNQPFLPQIPVNQDIRSPQEPPRLNQMPRIEEKKLPRGISPSLINSSANSNIIEKKSSNSTLNLGSISNIPYSIPVSVPIQFVLKGKNESQDKIISKCIKNNRFGEINDFKDLFSLVFEIFTGFKGEKYQIGEEDIHEIKSILNTFCESGYFKLGFSRNASDLFKFNCWDTLLKKNA